MPLNPLLNIDLNFFTNKKNLGNTAEAKMKAVYFDAQFNLISNYINDSIIPLLNQLVTNVIPGTSVLGTANKLWVNTGDGTTRWDKITGASILDNSIAWSKLSFASVGSVLTTNAAGNYISAAPTAPNQVLFSRDANTPYWRLVNGEDFADRSIPSDKIALGTIKAENFQDGLLIPQLYDNVISTIKIADNTITTSKIADGAITASIIPNFLTTYIERGAVFIHTLPDGFVNDTRMLTDDFRVEFPVISSRNLNGVQIVRRTQFADSIIPPDKIADGAIQGSYIQNLLQNIIPADTVLGNNKIKPEQLPANYRAVLGV